VLAAEVIVMLPPELGMGGSCLGEDGGVRKLLELDLRLIDLKQYPLIILYCEQISHYLCQ